VSWDAYLTDDRGHTEGDWNYTHNCNGMIAEALTDLGCVNAKATPDDHPIWKAIGPPWWKRLDGCDGPTGAAFLDALIRQLESNPVRYSAMNPANGWGSYETLVKVLTGMRDAVPEWPTTWRVHG